MTGSLDHFRHLGICLLCVAGWLTTETLLVLCLQAGQAALVAMLVSAAMNVLPTACALSDRHDRAARLLAALMAALQPGLAVYALQDAVLQLDMHMYFFVALSMVAILCDTRAILAASAAVVLHHLVLSLAAPAWVFTGGGGVPRVLVHAVAVAMQAGALCFMVNRILGMIESLDHANEASNASAQDARNALKQVERERQRGLAIEATQRGERHAELDRLASEFEISVRDVAQAVLVTAETLQGSTRSLDAVAKQTRLQAASVEETAKQASTSAQAVASGVAKLSGSITNIAVNANQQKELSIVAKDRSASGGSALDNLSDRSKTISDATKSIMEVAQSTSLLSLNATIEAALAGPAGRGFTIVAGEVKALANQAALAAGHIDRLLTSVRDGTVEAEKSFIGIEETIAELNSAAFAILEDIETQQSSADAIEAHASKAASQVNFMAEQSGVLAEKADLTKTLSGELDMAAATLIATARNLESATDEFVASLRNPEGMAA